MHIMVIGLSHKTVTVDMREKFYISSEHLQAALLKLRKMKSILECVIVSTCNRMEIYIVCDQLHTGEYYTKTFIETTFKFSKDVFVSHLYIKKNMDAVRHLFHVICGQDSLIVGETQILGQIRNAFLIAQSSGTTGTFFNQLFKQAITLGKKVHTKARFENRSISDAACELAKKVVPTIQKKDVLLIGTGKMSHLLVRYFLSCGVKKICVISRTLENAKGFGKTYGITPYAYSEMGKLLIEVDLVISCTSSNEPIITRPYIQSIIAKRKARLTLIDMGVPLNIDVRVREEEKISLYNMDNIQDMVIQNQKFCILEEEKIASLILKEEVTFFKWLRQLGVLPLICALREKATSIQEEVILRIERKCPDLTEQQRRVIWKQTRSIINQLLKEPIIRIKELASTSNKAAALEMFIHLHALEEELGKPITEENFVASW